MCGIIGYIGEKPAVPVLLDGLKRLEYRGYDSAGLAVVDRQGKLEIRRAEGKLRQLEEAVSRNPVEGAYGLGHTRWATHGRPTEENAHPHRDCTGRIVVVHNGIIENYLPIKKQLESEGHWFVTETDTEVIAHMVEKYVRAGENLAQAVRRSCNEMRGIFAFALTSADVSQQIVAVRQGPPIIVGLGDGEYFVASDIPAILQHTRDVLFLGDGEMAVLTRQGVTVFDFEGREKSGQVQRVMWDPIMAEKGGYRHFMLKEIHEQPRAVRDTLKAYASVESGEVYLDQWNVDQAAVAELNAVKIVACGTSFHAGLLGKCMIETLAELPVEVDYASEFRYRRPILDGRSLVLAITQSGETADTLAAARESAKRGSPVVAITNVVGSTITREAQGVVATHAGPEIGVASTKTFATQLVALYLLAIKLARWRGQLHQEQAQRLVEEIHQVPIKMEKVLEHAAEIEALARQFYHAQNFLYLGRGVHYPIALEGALKLKELSYIHAEGCPAGEMKHGPNALLDENLPVVVINTHNREEEDGRVLYEKTLANMQEVKARGAKLIALVNEADDEAIAECRDDLGAQVLPIPPTSQLLSPLVAILPLQLLAYHVAVLRGCDVDQPRNLAKSVTVE